MSRVNVVLIAEESAGIRTLQALSKARHNLIAVMASETRKQLTGATVWSVASELGIRTWPAKGIKDPTFAKELKSHEVDVLLSVRSLYIIPSENLSAPRIGAFNLHSGPLPKYGGRNVVSRAICNGERTHGVTVHRMVADVDAGPIAYEQTFPIEEDDSALALTRKCIRAGIPLVLKLLDAAATDPDNIPQRSPGSPTNLFLSSERPRDGRLSWRETSRKVVDFARACDYFPFESPWGLPRFRIGRTSIGLAKARMASAWNDIMPEALSSPGTVGAVDGTTALVACGDGWIVVEELEKGGERVAASALLSVGDHLADG